MKKFKECTSEEIRLAISNSENLNQVCKQLLCTNNTYNINKIRDFIKSNNLSTEHFKIRYSKESYDKNPKVCKYCGKIIPYENELMISVIILVQLVIIILEQYEINHLYLLIHSV